MFERHFGQTCPVAYDIKGDDREQPREKHDFCEEFVGTSCAEIDVAAEKSFDPFPPQKPRYQETQRSPPQRSQG